MSAETAFFSKELLSLYANTLIDRLTSRIIKPTPEWSAWAAEWREEVPLTAQQKRENAAWGRRVERARRALNRALESFAEIERKYGVSVAQGCYECEGEPSIEAGDPPHKTTYRTRPGAPPEPPFWPKVVYGSSIKWVRHEDINTTGDPMT